MADKMKSEIFHFPEVTLPVGNFHRYSLRIVIGLNSYYLICYYPVRLPIASSTLAPGFSKIFTVPARFRVVFAIIARRRKVRY